MVEHDAVVVLLKVVVVDRAVVVEMPLMQNPVDILAIASPTIITF